MDNLYPAREGMLRRGTCVVHVHARGLPLFVRDAPTGTVGVFRASTGFDYMVREVLIDLSDVTARAALDWAHEVTS